MIRMKIRMLKDIKPFKEGEVLEVEAEDDYFFIIREVNGDEEHAIAKINAGRSFEVVEEEENDNVNQPRHYTAGKYEVIDVIEDRVERLPGKEAFHVANITKYISRYDLKNGVEDLKKARFYLDRLIDLKEESE